MYRFINVCLLVTVGAFWSTCDTRPVPHYNMSDTTVRYPVPHPLHSPIIKANVDAIHSEDSMIRLDDAYFMLIQPETIFENLYGRRIAFQDLQTDCYVEVHVNPLSFTTSTVGIPKWAAGANRIVVHDCDRQNHPYLELHVRPGEISLLSTNELERRYRDTDGRWQKQLYKIRPELIEWSNFSRVQFNQLYADVWPTQSSDASAQNPLEPSYDGALILSYRDADYQTYINAIRNPDYGDIPPEIYSDLSLEVVRIVMFADQ